MNKFTKISGIIGALIILAGVLLVLVNLVESNTEDRLILLALLLPLFFVSQFYIRYRFGFTAEDIPRRGVDRFIDRIAVVLMLVIVGSGLFFTATYFLDRKHEKELKAQCSGYKKWVSDTMAYNLIARLETKYDGMMLQYKLAIQSDSTNRFRLRDDISYVLNFYDKEGFSVAQIRCARSVNISNAMGQVVGHSLNREQFMDVETYAKISNWDITYVEGAWQP
ncbi:MAG: hypothetical protein RL160_1689 [Bacteroidota bacterium]|jgi:hypothetical protein